MIDLFYQLCFDAGESCALRVTHDSGAGDLKARVNGHLAKLALTPVAFQSDNRYILINDVSVRALILKAIFGPLQLFPQLAEQLSAIVSGNYSAFSEFFPQNGTYPDTDYSFETDIREAVSFSDAHPEIADKDPAWFETYYNRLNSTSPTIGPYSFGDITLGLSGRRLRDKYAFLGPWGTPKNHSKVCEPVNPLLFLSARLDPVTPLKAARKMMKTFEGAALLVQESAGHCAFFSAPSNCTNNVLREYFASGTLPSKGKTCQADCKPFAPCSP